MEIVEGRGVGRHDEGGQVALGVDRRVGFGGQLELPGSEGPQVRRAHGRPRLGRANPRLIPAQVPQESRSRGSIGVGDQQYRHLGRVLVDVAEFGEVVLRP